MCTNKRYREKREKSKDPEYKKSPAEYEKNRRNENKEMINKRVRERRKDPFIGNRIREVTRLNRQKPENKEKIKIRDKKRYNNPEIREKILICAKKRYNDPETNKKIKKYEKERRGKYGEILNLRVREKRKNPSYKQQFKERDRIHQSKRRELGFTPINKEFQDSVGHHLLYNEKYEKDNDTVIFIPRELHKLAHGRDKPDNQQEVNIKAAKYLMDHGETGEQKNKGARLYTAYCLMPAPYWFYEEYENSKHISIVIKKLEELFIGHRLRS
jgi:hypothetical protein